MSSNLITVPACRPCNKSYELDDEHFRVFALAQATFDPRWEAFWDEKVRGSSFRRSPKFHQAIRAMVEPVQTRTQSGLYVKTEGLAIPRARPTRVIERIVRALLWHHHQLLPKSTSEFMMRTASELGDAAFEILKVMPPGVVARSIGGDVFRYRGAPAIDGPDNSFWILAFYGKLALFVCVSHGQARAEGSVRT